MASDFRSLFPIDGYLPLEDYGLIGDGATAALVGRNGSLDWLCVPRFDAPPLFCALLDRDHGGRLRIAPEELIEARHHYAGDTGVLVTELRSPTGCVAITDALTLHHGADLREDVPAARGELLRQVRVLEGRVRLQVEVTPRGGAAAEVSGGGLRLRSRAHPGLELYLGGSLMRDRLTDAVELAQGEERFLVLRWGGGDLRRHPPNPDELLAQTLGAWQRWIGAFGYEGVHREAVRRSALTLKLLDHFENGAIVAAPTSSLPECIGGERNWDYRYAWIRDAAFSVYALRRIGFPGEAWGFLAWVLEAIERDRHPHVLYDLDGRRAPPEEIDEGLAGYRQSRPVRWGNGARAQRQHDVYGEVLDCAWQWVAGGRRLEPAIWRHLRELVDAASREWREPDHGIWEVRTAGRPYTYSAALCQVALDRGARLSEELGLPGDAARWHREAAEIRERILTDAWSAEQASLTEDLSGEGGLDASLLALPLRRVVPADHPRMAATANAIARRLGAGDGLLYRYLPEHSPDGLPGGEGAFLLCSFWLVDNLVGQRRLEKAETLLASLCARASPLGLLPEQIDPRTGAFLGNFPQAFSHVGLIASAFNLTRRSGRLR